ncbi:hypothetical protein FNCV3_00500 [Fusobacterium nucleatum]|nr:hypothetical protein FNCV3_00500 [Fusobacterium nucleatum]BEP06326.1 hypothetical protein FNSV3_16730 [Fusobacterium nucleatum]
MKVFIGGPLKIRTLKPDVISKLNSIIKKKYKVLIGDANGVDKTIQNYFFNKKYKNVEIYSVNKFRNNLGGWKSNVIKVETKVKNREYYSIKDRKMAEIADVGLMIWNKKSEGTLNNILNLLILEKKVCLFIHQESKLVILKEIKDLESIVNAENSIELMELYLKSLENIKKSYKESEVNQKKKIQLSLKTN